MRKKQQKKINKKWSIILFIIISFFWFRYCVNAIENNKQEKEKKIQEEITLENSKKIFDKKLNKIFLRLEIKKTKTEQKYIYKTLTNILEKRVKNNTNGFLLNHIIKKIKQKNNSINIEKINFSKHNTKILKFTRNANHNIILDNILNKNKINKFFSIFIFRTSSDLSRVDINFITKKIKKYNKNILIFIDQEWWLINRYVEFEKTNDVEEFFWIIKNNKYNFLKTRFAKLNQKEIKIIRNIFPKKYWYFPTLWKIWKTYDLFETKKKKKAFLEIIAFIRLQTLKNNWINTYWLVADLNRWNPVISGTSRSFSKHLWKYKQLIDAFVKASRKTEITLYLKHFPWHWAGKIDSHKWILTLSWQEKYLKENLELFDYFLENSDFLQTWLMIWHMYIPKSLKKKFDEIINKADFLLTDDLAMIWYKKAKWKIKKDLFFTTDKIINKNNLIIVNTINIAKIK